MLYLKLCVRISLWILCQSSHFVQRVYPNDIYQSLSKEGIFMKLINRLKVFERKYVFLRWATGAEYGKITYVGDDYVEFNIIDVDTMEYRETTIINSSLILEAVFGGPDISRIVAEISSMLPDS